MINVRLKKGFNLNLYGETEELIVDAPVPELVGILPSEFIGCKPGLIVSKGDKVKLGSVLFYDKNNPVVKFTSPVSGKIEEIIRGDRRRLEAIVIRTDGNRRKNFSIPSGEIKKEQRDTVLNLLFESGLFPYLIQRPFGRIAVPEKLPRDIFVSAMNTAPLAPDSEIIVSGREEYFQKGLDVLSILTDGRVYLVIDGKKDDVLPVFLKAQSVELCRFSGPHPAGNCGVHIHHIKPIMGRHDTVWTCSVEGVIQIGHLFCDAKISSETIIAVAGSAAKGRAYYRTTRGAQISSFVNPVKYEQKTRFISGDVLTGRRSCYDGFAGFYNNLVTVIPEPDEDRFEFLGWAEPGFGKFSRSMTYLSNYIRFGNKFTQKASLNGSRRAFIATGIYEKVLPMDLFPVFLLKSIEGGDVGEIEGLGIYDVIEEDIALCEYIDPSKNSMQQMLRKGLDLVEKEG